MRGKSNTSIKKPEHPFSEGKTRKKRKKDSTPVENLSQGARGVMVIVVGNGHGDTSSNP